VDYVSEHTSENIPDCNKEGKGKVFPLQPKQAFGDPEG
jgi:hypothetical protein